MHFTEAAEKFSSLQILRAVAAWMVVYHHFMQSFFEFKSESFLGHFFSKYGGLGVDIFFVLSGFVMFAALRSGKPSASRFAVGRFFRIVPAYWLYTFVVVARIHAFPEGFLYTDYDLKSCASLLFVPTRNPSGIGEYTVLTVGWTLNFEMFFYLVLALSILINKRRPALVCFLIILPLPLIYPPNFPLSRVLASHLLYEFLIGLIVAAVLFNARTASLIGRYRHAIAYSLVLTGIASFALMDSFRILKLAGCGSLVFAAVLLEPFAKRKSCFTRSTIRLGDESYSTYLLHPIVIGIAVDLFGKAPRGILLPVVFVTVTLLLHLASRLSYMHAENSNTVGRVAHGVAHERDVHCSRSLTFFGAISAFLAGNSTYWCRLTMRRHLPCAFSEFHREA